MKHTNLSQCPKGGITMYAVMVMAVKHFRQKLTISKEVAAVNKP